MVSATGAVPGTWLASTHEIGDRDARAGLAVSYEHCRALHRAHGRTYYLATRLLPVWKRRHVHALYGFTRYTDDLVDQLDRTTGRVYPGAERAQRLRNWTDRFLAALRGEPTTDPVLPAVVHTIAVFDLDRRDFRAFLRSMEMDLSVSRYRTYDDLLEYMEGSAAVIGTMMLPILGARDVAAARIPARELGLAFQLTNFIRDVGEDLRRDRLYLPTQDLATFGVHIDDLHENPPPAVRELLAFEVARAHRHYARAAHGIPMLSHGSQACIRAAYRLYGAILDEVVAARFDVFARRATVKTSRRLATAAACLLTPPGWPVRAPRARFGGAGSTP